MIVSGYTLHLYCDCGECKKGRYDAMHVEIADEEKEGCFRMAKIYGWRIDKSHGTCYAPGHAPVKKEDIMKSELDKTIDVVQKIKKLETEDLTVYTVVCISRTGDEPKASILYCGTSKDDAAEVAYMDKMDDNTPDRDYFVKYDTIKTVFPKVPKHLF